MSEQEKEVHKVPLPEGPVCGHHVKRPSGAIWVCVVVPHPTRPDEHYLIREDRLGL